MLTRKQYELLVFINRRLSDGGVSPSFEEMKEALGLKSKSGIHRLISGLEERGFIRRLPHRARALEVVRLPEDTAISGVRGRSGGAAERSRFSVTSLLSMRATTIWPLSAVSQRWINTVSPSRMPASTMLSPATSRA